LDERGKTRGVGIVSVGSWGSSRLGGEFRHPVHLPLSGLRGVAALIGRIRAGDQGLGRPMWFQPRGLASSGWVVGWR
jgi:hypothetical protein